MLTINVTYVRTVCTYEFVVNAQTNKHYCICISTSASLPAVVSYGLSSRLMYICMYQECTGCFGYLNLYRLTGCLISCATYIHMYVHV